MQSEPEQPISIPEHRLLKLIGRGSYGEVWLAQNTMGTYRAVKIVYRKSFSDARPFERELSGIRKFEPISRSHEGFLDILHVGICSEAGYFYYVMELGDDQTSGSAIQPDFYTPKTLSKSISQNGRLPLEECLQLGLAVSLALHELHKHGLVHRDVKPSNIIYVNGVPKLADIGLVADINEARSYVGTEGFIPPEGPGSLRADIYSLGKTLYEVSTGKDRHDFPELPTLLDQIPDQDGFLELNEVILKACKSEPQTRYQSAWDMHGELAALAAGKSVKRLRALERRFKNLKRGAGVTAAILAVCAAAILQVYRDWKASLESRQRKVGASIAYGNQALNSGDLLGALPYFADAMQVDAQNAKEERTHRLRFGATLAQCPKLTHVWSEGIWVGTGEFSPDDNSILAAEFQGSLLVRDLQKGTIHSLPFYSSNWLSSASFSPNGQMIVTANANGAAYILESGSLKLLCRLPHPDQLTSARFSPDGLRMVTACRDGAARVWNLQTRTVEFTLRHSRKVRFADFSPDGHLVVTAGEDSMARIWDAATGQLQKELPHAEWVVYAAFSPDGQKVVTACTDHKARVWEVRTGLRIMPDLSHLDGVMSAEFSPDGRLILTASLDRTARLWRADTLEPLSPNPILWHGERLTHASFSHDSRQIVTTGVDGTIRVWDLAGSVVEPCFQLASFSSDGQRFLARTNDCIEVRNVASNTPIGPRFPVNPSWTTVELSGNGDFIVAVSPLGKASETRFEILDSRTGALVAPGILMSNVFTQFAVSPDGKRLLAFGGSVAQLWDVHTGTALSLPLTHEQAVRSAIFNHDATRFAIVSGRRIEVRSGASGHLCFPPLEMAQSVHDAEFSHDGRLLVGCCWDSLLTKCYAQVWNSTTGQATGPQLNHGDGVLFASFSPDDKRIVTASEDFTAIEWDTLTGARLIPPLEHDEKVRSACFSQDGKWIVTASDDKTARVWNAETGDPLTPPLRHLIELTNAMFLSDGDQVITRDGMNCSYIWSLPVDSRPIGDLMTLASLLAGRTQTRFGQATETIESTWNRLRARYPSTFETSPGEIDQWHEFQAEESDVDQQLPAEVFHLKCLSKLHPEDKSFAARITAAMEHIAESKPKTN